MPASGKTARRLGAYEAYGFATHLVTPHYQHTQGSRFTMSHHWTYHGINVTIVPGTANTETDTVMVRYYGHQDALYVRLSDLWVSFDVTR